MTKIKIIKLKSVAQPENTYFQNLMKLRRRYSQNISQQDKLAQIYEHSDIHRPASHNSIETVVRV